MPFDQILCTVFMFLERETFIMKKRDVRFISFTTALTLILAMIPVFNISVSAAVTQLPNRQVVYNISNDQSEDWVPYSGANITHSLTNGVLTATNEGDDNRPIWRYFDSNDGNITASLADQTNIEVEFDISMTSYNNDSSFSVMGSEHKGQSHPSDGEKGDAIIMLKHEKSSGIVKINSNGTPIMKSDNKNVIPKFRVHAVINFINHSYDLTTYTLDENDNPTEYATVTNVKFNSDISTVAGFFARISNPKSSQTSSITLSNAKIFVQGQSELTNTIYDLSTDIQDT